MAVQNEWKWEFVSQKDQRMIVPGGWVLKSVTGDANPQVTMCYVPDPEYWGPVLKNTLGEALGRIANEIGGARAAP